MNALAKGLAQAIKKVPTRRYLAYIRSTQWTRVRNEHLARCQGVCEICHRARACQVHHWTYVRLGYEHPQDLCAVCIGRSRGGLTSKIHHLVDGAGRPLVVLVGAGQAHDGPVFEHLLAYLKVERCNGGRPRTRPDRVRGDKAYSNRAIRARLRRSRITAVIPEPSDQIAPP